MKCVNKMISLEEVKKISKTYSVIPVAKEINMDKQTPVGVLKKLAQNNKHYFLLESAEGGQKWGRYSFLGFDPIKRISCMENIVTLNEEGSMSELYCKNPYEILQKIQSEYKGAKLEHLPPFTGGLVGYFSYAMFNYTEPKLNIKRGELKDYDVMLFSKIIAFDNLRNSIFIIVNMNTDSVSQNYASSIAEIEKIEKSLSQSEPEIKNDISQKVIFSCNLSQADYCNMVENAKEYIRQGDVFQVVLSRQFKAKLEGDLIGAYKVLRKTNPSPYMVYINFGEEELICSSPETLVSLHGRILTTMPVAGSRPRGKSDKEDCALEFELLRDEKELSEHNMLVDLGRNDLGKISKFNTVEVTEYMAIHRYSKVMHICSRVVGEAKDSCDGYTAIETLLPAGTLSGAPKFRACQIIEELEESPRGIYGGAIGYIGFNGDMDSCIAIRMAVKKGNTVYVQAGAGIVVDSIPMKEYEETGNKAQALIDAILNAQEVSSDDPIN